MSDHSLTISLQSAALGAGDDPYWVRIEQEGLGDDTAMVSDAADMLDALYQIEPCTQLPTVPSEAPAVDEAGFAEAVSRTLDFAACSTSPDGSVEVAIRIIRSHLDEPYRLQLQGGTVVGTITISEQITRYQEITQRLTLDYPVVGTITASPPFLSRQGNTLLFAEDLAGRVCTATYLTQYDLVTISIAGVDGEPGHCTALVFFHGLVEELDPQPPQTDDIDLSWCPQTVWEVAPDEVSCYEAVTVHRRCSCSDTEVGTYSYEQEVDCPERVTRCPGTLNQCRHLVGSRSVVERVNCGDADTTAAADRDFYEATCCEVPQVPLPPCQRQVLTYRGGQSIVNGEEHYRSLYGQAVRFVPLTPDGGICGEHTIEQRIMGNNCCDGVPELVVSDELSITVLSPPSNGYMFFSGGQRPVEVVIRGEGFDFGSGRKKLTTTDSVVRVYARDQACGVAIVEITDGCTSATGTVKSTIGQWVDRPDDTIVTDPGKLVPQPHDPAFTYQGTCCGDIPLHWCHTYSSSPYSLGIGESAQWLVSEYRMHKYWGGPSYASCDQCPPQGLPSQVPGWACGPMCWAKYDGYECDYIQYRYVQEWVC